MLTRRDFVKKGVALVTLGTAHATLPAVFKGAFAIRAAEAAPDAASRKTLVIVQLAGGNDGQNTIVPYRDPAYRKLRPTLGVPSEAVLPLDEQFGLHPALGALQGAWDAESLAIVHGVGYPDPNLSHFQAMLIWQRGGPQAATGEGWLGNYLARLEAEQHDPLHGFNVGQFVPQELYASAAPIISATDAESYGFRSLARDEAEQRRRQTALLKLYEQFPKNMPYAALLESTAGDAVSSEASLAQAASGYTPAVAYPQTPLASGLQLIAQVIASGADLRIAHVTLGGFDTHSAQLTDHEALLRQLGDALAAFHADLAAQGRDGDVLTMTWSEFGRRIPENASEGTDHGTAAPMFLLGGGVAGGFYGEPASLEDLDDGNLKFTTDFRSVYASVLDHWIGVPSAEMLGGTYAPIEGLLG